ncbi:hypothetical protein MBLNU457_5362t1 [Dothideomycetes sp. NU457]
MSPSNVSIDRLLNLVPEHPDQVLSHLSNQPELAGRQDRHGYSLLHAATSYNHADLLRKLVHDFKADVNTRDEDGETPLFVAENVDIARTLVEELGVDINAQNDDGQTAEQKMDADEEWPLVTAYLREASTRSSGQAAASVVAQTGGANNSSTAQAGTLNGSTNGVSHPPPVPAGISDVKIGTMPEPSEEEAPDPEFRRRIEELAASDDFQTEDGQQRLRELVQDALSGMHQPNEADRNVRRREE